MLRTHLAGLFWISCSRFGYHDNQNSKFISWGELAPVHMKKQQNPPPKKKQKNKNNNSLSKIFEK